jgi:hypothetical protein
VSYIEKIHEYPVGMRIAAGIMLAGAILASADSCSKDNSPQNQSPSTAPEDYVQFTGHVLGAAETSTPTTPVAFDLHALGLAEIPQA